MKKLLEDYILKYPNESIEKFLELLEEENAYNRDNLQRHFTASAWVIHPTEKLFLLCHHSKLNKWIQVGGHADGDENLEFVARKECSEEAGLNDLDLIDGIFDLDIHNFPARGSVQQHEHYDVRFFFKAKTAELKANNEVKDLQWVSLDQISEYNNSESILRMVRKTASYL